MFDGHHNEVTELFRLIDEEWAVCDDQDEDPHFVLVDEGRTVHPTVRPSKDLVMKLVDDGLLEFEDWSQQPGDERANSANPLVYSFRVTTAGRNFDSATPG